MLWTWPLIYNATLSYLDSTLHGVGKDKQNSFIAFVLKSIFRRLFCVHNVAVNIHRVSIVFASSFLFFVSALLIDCADKKKLSQSVEIEREILRLSGNNIHVQLTR